MDTENSFLDVNIIKTQERSVGNSQKNSSGEHFKGNFSTFLK